MGVGVRENKSIRQASYLRERAEIARRDVRSPARGLQGPRNRLRGRRSGAGELL